jgi:hypothetical protein
MTYKWQSNTKFYYNLLLQDYMFRLLGVILRPSIEPNQDYLITGALRDPVALTIGGVHGVWNYSAHCSQNPHSALSLDEINLHCIIQPTEDLL